MLITIEGLWLRLLKAHHDVFKNYLTILGDISQFISQGAQRLLKRACRLRSAVTSAVTPATATFYNTLPPVLQQEKTQLVERRNLRLLQAVSNVDKLPFLPSDAQTLITKFRAESSTDLKV